MSTTLTQPGLDTDQRSGARVAAPGLVASAVLAATGAVILGAAFDWPAVLDEPGTVGLPAFAEDESAIRFGFVLMLVSSLVLIPAAIGLERLLGPPGRTGLRVLTTFGVVGAAFQMLGWVRWPVAVPGLAERYLDPEATQSEQDATAAAYDVLNGYAGGAVGEHLGWLLQAPWAIGIAAVLLGARLLPRWFAATGLVTALVWTPLIVGEPYVEAFASDGVAAVAFGVYTVWYVWLGALGVWLLARLRFGAR